MNPLCPVCGARLVRGPRRWFCPAEPLEVLGPGKSPDWPRRRRLARHAGPVECSDAATRLLAWGRPPPEAPEAAPDGSWVALVPALASSTCADRGQPGIAWWTAAVYRRSGLPFCSGRAGTAREASDLARAAYRVLLGRTTSGWTGPVLVLVPAPREEAARARA